jgi:hypothetical protein
MGRRGDGEMGRWGDGETGRRGDGEMGRWGDGETGRRGDGELICQVFLMILNVYSLLLMSFYTSLPFLIYLVRIFYILI